MTPFSYAIATIKCKCFPSGKHLLPLAVNFSPSPLVLHTLDFGCTAPLKDLTCE